jgi:hypothetical protein
MATEHAHSRPRAILALPLLLASGFALTGCVAGMAAGALGAAVQAGSPKRAEVSDDRRSAATAACEARASAEGRVHIIDSEQRRGGHVVVWGIVDDQRGRRAFECRWDRAVRGFTLRTIQPR